MRKGRLTVLLSFAAVSLIPLVAVASPGACPARVTTSDGWQRAAGPRFAAGGGEVTAYAADPSTPEIDVATNGAALARTGDAGCAWSAVFTMPETPSADVPFSRDTAAIVDVVSGARRTYALVTGTTGTRVVTSTSGGRTWTVAKGVVPAPPGAPAPQLATDLDGTTAYLLAQQPASLLGAGGLVLYGSTDGGETWTPHTVDPTLVGLVENVHDIAVDPLDPSYVWLATEYGLLRSDDGGNTWTATDVGGAIGFVSATHHPGERVQVVAASAVESIVNVGDGEQDWTKVNTPGVVESAAGGPTASDLAIATKSGVYVLDFAELVWSAVHTGSPGLVRLTTDYGPAPAYHACACGSGTSLWTRRAKHVSNTQRAGSGSPSQPGPGLYFGGYYGCAPTPHAPPVKSFPDSAVEPATKEISLAAGQSVTVPYRFTPQPRELDLFFLLSTGPRSAMYGCAQELASVWAAQTLARETNLRVGLGEYRDYNLGQDAVDFLIEQCLEQTPGDFVYKRDLLVGPVDATFRQRVSGLRWGGNCTDDHANLPALYQLATGLGQDIAPPGPSPYDIRTGQVGGFAHDALRVVMHVSGSWFEYPKRTPGYPGPAVEDVVSALRSAGIRQLGIYVPNAQAKLHQERFPASTGTEDLRQMARETGAVADRPVACAADPRLPAMLRPGDPLVCTYPIGDSYSEGEKVPKVAMGRQMVNLVGSLHDPRPMRLTVLSGDAVVSAPKAPSYDYLRANALPFTVTYRCGATESGRTKHVDLGGVVNVGGNIGESVVADATTIVHCGPQVAPVRPFVGIVPPPLAPLPAPAAPAANPLPNPNPAPNPAAQPQAQPQGMPQAVAVPQEQAQPQVAYAENEVTEHTGPEYAMNRLAHRRTPPPWLPAQLGGLVMCATAAVAMARHHLQRSN